MTNEEIKALLRELSETADAAGVSKKVRITFDEKRRTDPAQEAQTETAGPEPDPSGDESGGGETDDQGKHGEPDPEGTVYYDPEKAVRDAGRKAERKAGGLFGWLRKKRTDEEAGGSNEISGESANSSGDEPDGQPDRISSSEAGGENGAQTDQDTGSLPADGRTAERGRSRETLPDDEPAAEAGGSVEPLPDNGAGAEEGFRTGSGADRAGSGKSARGAAARAAAGGAGGKNSGQGGGKDRTRASGRIPVEEPEFEKDAADFRDNAADAAVEESESRRIRKAKERMTAFKSKLKAKGIGRKQLLILAAVLLIAAVIAVVVLYILSNRAKSEHVTADEGLRILVQKEPSKWCKGGTVTLEIRTDEPMQSVSVGGNTTAYNGETKTQLTFETGEQTAEVMVVTQEQVLNAIVDFPKIDTEAPSVRVEEQDGLVTLTAQDLRSGVDQVWYGTIEGLSDVPAYQLYTEPFKPEEGKLYAYFARDKAGNQSSRVTTNMEAAKEISLPRQEIALFQGETFQMDLAISPANAFLNDLEWTSSSPESASVDQNGLVTALSDGEAVIQAEASGVKGVSCLVRVRSEVDLTISAAGDCTLGEDINFSPINSFSTVQSMYGSSYFLENVRSIFETDDITFVNLEGTLTDQGTRMEKQYAFRGDPSYTQILTSGSVEAVTLANNHSSDYGQVSLEDTQKYLDQAGIEWCNGDKIIVKDVNGVRVALIGIYVLAEGEAKADQVQTTIAAAKEDGAQVIIVAFHWGNEMETSPDKVQQTLAHLAVDCGADLVVGHHPHVLQGIEKYSGKYICYSLGNFCFGGNSNPSDMDTMIFRQTFRVLRGGEVENGDVSVIPCRISSTGDWNNYQPTPAQGEEKERILAKINELSEQFDVSF